MIFKQSSVLRLYKFVLVNTASVLQIAHVSGEDRCVRPICCELCCKLQFFRQVADGSFRLLKVAVGPFVKLRMIWGTLDP